MGHCVALTSRDVLKRKEPKTLAANSAEMNCGQEKSSWGSGPDGEEMRTRTTPIREDCL